MENAWVSFIYQPFGGFIIILLGTMLLLAEVLVKGRFIFGITGLILMSLYFSAHVQEGHALWMGIIYMIGIMLVILDGKFIGDGTIGGIGLILMIVALAIPSPSILYGVTVICAFLLGMLAALLFMKFIPKREVWSKLALYDALTSEQGYNSMNVGYSALIGKKGIADTDFRPSGTIRIDGKTYSAVSNGKWIKKGTTITVIEVNGTRILIEEVDFHEGE